MSRACFDPEESTKMWDRMSHSEGGGGLGAVSFLSTHPANAKRIKVGGIPTNLDLVLMTSKQLEQWIPEVSSSVSDPA